MGTIKRRARELRKNQTPAEKRLWDILRARKFENLKFRRQYPVTFGDGNMGKFNYFIVDFYCSELKLAFELDGSIHERKIVEDKERTRIMNELGINLVRFKNEDLDEPEKVLHFLKMVIVDIRKDDA